MFFSIIIPTYNNAYFLKKAIKSIENQTDNNFELIVIDNYSTDETSQIINKSKINNLVYKKIKNNGVIAKSRNMGIDVSRGDWIMFLDSDDFFYKNKINFYNKNLSDNFDIACNLKKIVNLDNGTSKIWRHESNEKQLYASMLISGNKFITSASVVKKDFIKKNNIFFNERKDFVTAEDYDFFLNVTFKGARVRFFNEVLGDYSYYTGSQSSNYALHKNSIQNVLKQHVFEIQNFSKDKKTLWEKLQWRFIIMDFIKEFKDKNYIKSIRYLLNAFYSSPLMVINFFFKKMIKNKFI